MTVTKNSSYMSSSNCGFAAGTSFCVRLKDTALLAVSIFIIALIPLLAL